MADYIERDFALDVIKRTSGDYAAAWAEIAHAPSSDVEPVVHGEWENHFDYKMERSGFYVCTQCIKMSAQKSDYCPNCGAKMDGAE